MAEKLLDKLVGGDRRSIGRSDEVVFAVLKRPALFHQLITGLQSDDPVVRMRAADAGEKVSRMRPELLQPFRAELLRLLRGVREQELRWHLAQMVPRISLTKNQRLSVVAVLRRYLGDDSSIVKTFALQALAEIAEQEKSLQREVRELLLQSSKTGTAAMKARSRQLLKNLAAN